MINFYLFCRPTWDKSECFMGYISHSPFIQPSSSPFEHSPETVPLGQHFPWPLDQNSSMTSAPCWPDKDEKGFILFLLVCVAQMMHFPAGTLKSGEVHSLECEDPFETRPCVRIKILYSGGRGHHVTTIWKARKLMTHLENSIIESFSCIRCVVPDESEPITF